ncbi:MAG: hypothetical protein AAGA02_13765 [Bacteroidota bacterium]
MGLEKTEYLLNKFGYSFTKKNNVIQIKMDFAQRLFIRFSESGQIIIKDKLVGWNFLTGLIEMNLKNAFLYNFVSALLITVLMAYFFVEEGITYVVFFYLIFITWLLLWTTYYLLKAESIKRVLISWNDDSPDV